MPKFIQFEEVEAIILVNVCQFITTCNLTKNSMFFCLSKVLRRLARNKGYDINNSCRSPSDLNYQIKVMFDHISGAGKITLLKYFGKHQIYISMIIMNLQKNYGRGCYWHPITKNKLFSGF